MTHELNQIQKTQKTTWGELRCRFIRWKERKL